MIKIRLSRRGKKGQPFYRIVAIEQRNKREGKAIETLGFFDPIKDIKKINQERLDYWKSKGAQLTKRVVLIFETQERKK